MDGCDYNHLLNNLWSISSFVRINWLYYWQAFASGVFQPIIFILINHIHVHVNTTVQRRHTITITKWILNICTIYTIETGLWDNLKNKRRIYSSKLVCFWEALIICLKLIIFGLSLKVVNLPVAFSLVY